MLHLARLSRGFVLFVVGSVDRTNNNNNNNKRAADINENQMATFSKVEKRHCRLINKQRLNLSEAGSVRLGWLISSSTGSSSSGSTY